MEQKFARWGMGELGGWGGGGRVEAGRRGEGCWGEVGVEARSSTI